MHRPFLPPSLPVICLIAAFSLIPRLSLAAEGLALPVIRPLPEFAKWTVTYFYEEPKKEGEKDAPANTNAVTVIRPIRTMTIKTKNIVSETIDYSNQTQTVRIYVDKTIYIKPPGSPGWIEQSLLSATPIDPECQPLPPSGYRDLGWLDTASCLGKASLEEKSCLVFVAPDNTDAFQKFVATKIPVSSEAASAAPPPPAAALQTPTPSVATSREIPDKQIDIKKLKSYPIWAIVNEETRRPAMVSMYGTMRVYSYDTPPTTIQSLPSDLKAAIKKGEEVRARIMQPATRPY